MSAASAWPACLVAAALLGSPACLAQAGAPLDAFGLLVSVQSRPSFAILGAGARAAGMGGAFTALADDASAVSFNPAGLALLVKPEGSLVFDGRSRSDRHAPFTGIEDGELESYDASTSSFETGGLTFASATYPVTLAGRNLAFQLSYHRLIDFTFESDRRFGEAVGGDPLASIRQVIDQRGDVHTLSLSAAYQATQRLSVGVVVSRWIGDWSFSTATSETPLDGGPPSALTFRQDNRWRGWNVTAGALLRYKYLNIGVTGRSPFDGDYTVTSALTTSFVNPFEPSSRFSGTLHWPSSWTVGVAVKPSDTWFLTADYAEFDWDDMLIEGLPGGSINFFDLRPPAESTTRNTGQWRFGTEYTFFPGRSALGVRAGYFVEPRPQLLSPGDEKSSVRGWSVGTGWSRGPVAVDIAYQRSSSTSRILQFVDPDTVAVGEVDTQAEGDVDTSEERLFLSVLYRFPSKRELRDLFHFLFVGPGDEGDGGEPADGGDEPHPRERRGPP